MRRNSLFSLENDGEVASELETSVEEGEVAAVDSETAPEVEELGADASDIAQGQDAAGDLEEVQDLVEDTVENGEGLDPVAAEAIRLAVKAICKRVNANPSSVYSAYSSENFRSPSSRKANSHYAAEGIGEFLKDLWKRIKTAVTNMFNKLKEFWNKHASSLGRVLKALESMKKKVSESSGKVSGSISSDKVPSSLSSAFPTDAIVSVKTIKEIIANHTTARSAYDTKSKKLESTLNATSNNIFAEGNLDKLLTSLTSSLAAYRDDGFYGSDTTPLVAGLYYKIDIDKTDADEGKLTFTIDEETKDSNVDDYRISIGTKEDIKGLLTSCVTIIKENIKSRDKLDKKLTEFNKMSNSIERYFNDAVANTTKVLKTDTGGAGTGNVTDVASAETKKKATNLMMFINLYMSKSEHFNTKISNLDIRLAKGVLGYASYCIKNFK